MGQNGMESRQATTYTTSSKRIARNTLMLYIRQILILLISLYTVRVVLQTLGAEDYGIYNAVAGVVTMLGFLSVSMANATQRFFSFAIGEGNELKLRSLFNVNMFVYGAIAVLAVLLLETFGYWFTSKELSIPAERYDAAVSIYHFAALSFVCSILSSPFSAIIIAHEDMHIYAGISIVEILMKLGVVLALNAFSGDGLKIYGGLLAVVALANMLMYVTACFRRYGECRFGGGIDRKLLREVTGFTSWTMFGQMSAVARHQMVTVMINQFFSPVIVAARAIANGVTSAATAFGNNFNKSLYPPIIKEYASGNRERMYVLVFNGCKMTFFLFWIIALPLIVEMETVLRLWLNEVPDYTLVFTRLSLIEVLISSISSPVTTAARAPGNMRTYELTLGVLQFMIPIVSWPFLKAGFSPSTVYYVAIAINIIMFVARLIIVRKLTGLPLVSFSRKVLAPVSAIMIVSSLMSCGIKLFFPEGVVMSIVVIVLSVFITSAIMYCIGLDKQQRTRVRDFVKSKLASEKSEYC